ncbi:aminopeptidase P family protein [Anoxybacterium hadale]|uniref:Aminopeptidase P family protein n=1 Tax=Anoxybacterium hadale TaxID=3408580 RepID=A0ACD1A8I1_9FIRM|nr:aminopeptidase P family protein [Clostridiales bacterium]
MTDKQKSNIVKSAREIESISKAAALGDRCFSHILGFIEPGMTDQQVADEIGRFLYAGGAEGLAFDTISVSGERSCLPHGEPTDKVIQKGEFLTMDFGAVIDGYCGDMTRTVAIGFVTDEMKRVYETVLEAQLAAIEFIKAGVACFDADKVARDIISNAGYGEYYPHGLGHGVGTLVHEAPTLNAKSIEILEKDMVITIEPGIYIPNKFGVRIEDLAIVTDFGIINKVESKKELIIL